MSNSNGEQVPQPIMISATNCEAFTGMSWDWITRFARAHGVPVWRLARKHTIPAGALAAALARAAAAAPPTDTADEVAQLREQIAASFR